MRFSESMMVGIPLIYFTFFSLLIITETDNFFLPEEGAMISGMMFEGAGDVSSITELTGVNVTDDLTLNPVNESGGVFGTVSIATSSIGYIKNIVLLEVALLSLPLQRVAGDPGDTGCDGGRCDIVVFNNLFWTLFVLPSHILTVFGVLFFLRSG